MAPFYSFTTKDIVESKKAGRIATAEPIKKVLAGKVQGVYPDKVQVVYPGKMVKATMETITKVPAGKATIVDVKGKNK